MTAMRCGTVALLGPPNAGKSTLLNALVGERLAIVGPKPQTTRVGLRGILNAPGGQLVFIDTPGLLQGKNSLEWGMREQAIRSAREADAVLLLASVETQGAWKEAATWIRPFASRSLLAITKADLGAGKAAKLGAELCAALGVESWLPVAALKGRGLPQLVESLVKRLPEGDPLYATDEITDLTLRQAAAEFIREQALLAVREELPHSLAVGMDAYRERPDGLHEVEATLYVERESQKGMIIGKGGSVLKLIGTRARGRLEKFAGAKVFLKLWVKVRKDWKKDPNFLKELGYPSAKEPA